MKALNAQNTRLIFITGTDTGVGKTVLTGLLLAHLRRRGCRALALKPFCSGGRGDAKLLQAFQAEDLSLDDTNPYHFPDPVAPLAAARKQRQVIPMEDVLKHIACVASQRLPSANRQAGKAAAEQFLLIEGAGGLLVPLGEGYTTLDLINALKCEVIVVSRNQLGTINHTLLTTRVLQPASSRITHHTSPVLRSRATAEGRRITVAFMDSGRPDASSRSNAAILAELLSPTPLVPIPWLGSACRTPASLDACATKLRARLAKFVTPATTA